jgi:hypothetical protein
MVTTALVLLLAFIPPPAAPRGSPSPAPTSTPRELKTIITVISSPYCNSLANHFNAALVPMLANDRTLDAAGVQLDNLDELFSEPDYEQRYVKVRDTLGREEAALNESMAAIKEQIGLLREGASLTTDAQAASQVTDAANELQEAWVKQRQLAIDLHGIHLGMIDYNIMTVPPPALGGFDEREMMLPKDMRDVKSYLRFDGQRDVVARAEDKAVDIAYDAVQRTCMSTK